MFKEINYTRINKTQARKAFYKGETIYICGNKTNPNNCWGLLFEANIKNQNSIDNFDKLLINWSYYNTSYELGYYAKFYIKED